MFLIPQKILYYTLPSGKAPFRDWFFGLDPTTADMILERIERAKFGYLGDYKNLGDGVFELRIHFGAGYRVYFARDGREIILLLSGGQKDRQSGDIKRAKIFWENYKNAKKN